MRLRNEALHRNALVREVHHRIKNNLQGITGLLSQFAKIHPETAEPITQAISQVQGISVIHGLQGRGSTSSVRLSELTQAIARDAEILWQTPFTVELPLGWRTHLVAEKEAVPIALILNELLLNAVKHGGKAHGHVRVTLQETKHDSASICITNTGQLPPDGNPIDVTHSGLKLISALMPPRGAHITRAQRDGDVDTVLMLSPPVIFIET
jgi:two-component sensor histidine kinase